MTAQEAQRHIRYTGWASGRLLNAAMKLDHEQLHREMNVSHKSIFETLSHIHKADRAWLQRVTASTIDQPEPLESAWPQIQQRWENWAAALQDSDLDRIIDYRDMAGNPHRSALHEIVLHVVNHATLHRGQVMGMFRQLGIQPPQTDLIFYYRETR